MKNYQKAFGISRYDLIILTWCYCYNYDNEACIKKIGSIWVTEDIWSIIMRSNDIYYNFNGWESGRNYAWTLWSECADPKLNAKSQNHQGWCYCGQTYRICTLWRNNRKIECRMRSLLWLRKVSMGRTSMQEMEPQHQLS